MFEVSIPGFYQYQYINTQLLTLLQNRPELFEEDFKITTIYDAFPGQRWNGGREMVGSIELPIIRSIINYYNAFGVNLRFTYINSLCNDEMLTDEYCNQITKIASKSGRNEIACHHPQLEMYLRDTYDFSYVASETNSVDSEDSFLLLLDRDYKTVIADSRITSKREFLLGVPHREKVEVILNDYCPPYCENRANHYETVSKAQIGGYSHKYRCPHTPKSQGDFFYEKSSDWFISRDEISQFVEQGITKFQISGRGFLYLDVIEAYVYYLVKPEYQNEVRYLLLRAELF